jgi:RNA polymerase sigma factor (TIGR02999 family)
MPFQDTHRITALLGQWKNGDDEAIKLAVPALYEELRRLAAAYVRREDGGETLQPTALVHEFYLHVAGLREVDWESRGQFMAAAARSMRNILVDNARRRNAAKRGGGRVDQLPDCELASPEPSIDLLSMDRALDKFARQYPRHASVVELMFFGGLNASEAAQVLSASGKSVSLRTVERDWHFARSWLQSEMAD